MTQIYIHPDGHRLEYQVYGRGSKCLICFHGFGESCLTYSDLSNHLDDYRVVAISLFFHGQSQYKSDSKYLHHQDWLLIFGDFLGHLGITTFDVICYSLGGRFAASTLQSFHSQIGKMVLVAPDGIVRRFWNDFAHFRYGGQQLFKLLIRHSEVFFSFVDLLGRFKLIPSPLIKFVRSQLKSKEDFQRVYSTWVVFKYFRMNNEQLISLINSIDTETTFIFGKRDNIISYQDHKRFLSQLTKSVVIIKEDGHNKLMTKSIDQIRNTLQP